MIKHTKMAPLFSPLALASWVAIGSVWISSAAGGLVLREGLPDWTVHGLMGLFTLTWAVRLLDQHQGTSLRHDAYLVALLVSALGLIAAGRGGTSPILLILLAVFMATRFSVRGLVLALIAVNAAFATLMMVVWQAGILWVLTAVGAFGSFQLFAVLLLRMTDRAECLAEELSRVNADLLATRGLLRESARDQERLRLSRELHDVAGHKLTALKLQLRQLSQRANLDSADEIKASESLAGELLDDLRGVVRQLRRNDGMDLAKSIADLTRPLPRPQLHVDLAGNARVPRADQAEALLRLIQEGLTNSARHGRADNAWLALEREHDQLVLDLEDDGQLQWPLQPGHGLTGMRERIGELGGELVLSRSDRGGLRITARLPLIPTAA